MALSLQRYMHPNNSNPLVPLLKERSIREREKSSAAGITPLENGDCLHENVIIEILSWLPVKDLLRYKTVCKSWHAMISYPDFIRKHLENYYRNNDDWHGCLLVQSYVTHCELQLFAMLLDETPRVLADDVLYRMPMYCSQVCGPCDGLYYLYETEYHRVLWNPAINEIKMLPPIVTEDYSYRLPDDTFVTSFGFDPVSRDYKVVVIKAQWVVCPNKDTEMADDPQSVFVYSMRNDSWPYCGHFRRFYNLGHSKCYNVVNGCCYWLESLILEHFEPNPRTCVIVSFNLATDAFDEIGLPRCQKPAFNGLANYNESLALLSVHENDEMVELWTFEDRIWILKFRVGPISDVMYPIGNWKDNRIILETRSRLLVLLDLESEEIVKDLGYHCPQNCEGTCAYMESLVSIKGEPCESDSGFGMNRLFYRESSESDSEYGIDGLFSSESDSEYGIDGLFSSEYDSEFDIDGLFSSESDTEYGIDGLFFSESDSEFGIDGLFSSESCESDSEYGIDGLFSSESSESDSEYGIDGLLSDESDSEFGDGLFSSESSESDSNLVLVFYFAVSRASLM